MFADVIVAAFAVDASATAIAAGIAAVGTDLSVVGTITGNKTLTEVGGVMSLAGGGFALAEGLSSGVTAGVASGAASDSTGLLSDTQLAAQQAAGTGAFAPTAADTVAGVTDSAAATLGGTAVGDGSAFADPGVTSTATTSVGAPSAGGSGMLSSATTPVTSAVPAAPTAPAATPMTAPDTSIATSTPVTGTAAPTAPAVSTDVTGAPSSSPGSVSGAPNATTSNDILDSSSAASGTPYNVGAGINGAAPAPPATVTTGDSLKAWYNNLGKDAQSRIVTGLMQAGGQAVGGMFNAWSASQKLALQQQAQDLIQQQYNTSVANANSIPTVGTAYKPASVAPVTMQNPTAKSTQTGMLST